VNRLRSSELSAKNRIKKGMSLAKVVESALILVKISQSA
jgi:hypothetical protein